MAHSNFTLSDSICSEFRAHKFNSIIIYLPNWYAKCATHLVFQQFSHQIFWMAGGAQISMSRECLSFALRSNVLVNAKINKQVPNPPRLEFNQGKNKIRPVMQLLKPPTRTHQHCCIKGLPASLREGYVSIVSTQFQ